MKISKFYFTTICLLIVLVFPSKLTGQCFSNNDNEDYYDLSSIRSIPQVISINLSSFPDSRLGLNAVFIGDNTADFNLLLVDDKNRKKPLAKAIYGERKEYEKFLNAAQNPEYSDGYILIGEKLFKENSNFLQILEHQSIIDKLYAELPDSLSQDVHDKLRNRLPEQIPLKMTPKLAFILAHEFAHIYQSHKIGYLTENSIVKENDEILELNADFIAGMIISKLLIDKIKIGVGPIKGGFNSFDIQFENIKDFRVRKDRSFKQNMINARLVADYLHEILMDFGDNMFFRKNHHGVGSERAAAFFTGYFMSYYNGAESLNVIEFKKDILERIIRIESSKDRWKN